LITGTIAVCTRNRAEVLPQCLASLETQVAEPGQIEVLVVDNGSTDGTPDLVRRWCEQGEERRAVTHSEVGLSGARNAALAASDRDVVLFVDDDALTPPTWARAHLQAYAGDDRAGTVGGPVGLTWPAGCPDWVSDEVTMWYSALDKGDDAGPFPGDHGPYGTNMSVRRTAALDVGGYDPGLGWCGGALLSGAEPAMTRRHPFPQRPVSLREPPVTPVTTTSDSGQKLFAQWSRRSAAQATARRHPGGDRRR
jgi:glycosyltransferase involved in cell wall biosynthesis